MTSVHPPEKQPRMVPGGLLPPLVTSGAPPVAAAGTRRPSLGPLLTRAHAGTTTADHARPTNAGSEFDLPFLVPGEPPVEASVEAAEPAWQSMGKAAPAGEADAEKAAEAPTLATAAGVDELSAEGGGATAESADPAGLEALTGGGERAAAIAGRLEEIARTLRDEGPRATLARYADDPLGAMIAGYLIGVGESSGER